MKYTHTEMPHEQKIFYVVTRLKCDSKGWNCAHIEYSRIATTRNNTKRNGNCFVRRLIGMNGSKLCYNIRLPLFVLCICSKKKKTNLHLILRRYSSVLFIIQQMHARTNTNTFTLIADCVCYCLPSLDSLDSRFNRMVCLDIPWYLHQLMDLCSLQAKYGSKPNRIEWNATLDHVQYSVGTMNNTDSSSLTVMLSPLKMMNASKSKNIRYTVKWRKNAMRTHIVKYDHCRRRSVVV